MMIEVNTDNDVLKFDQLISRIKIGNYNYYDDVIISKRVLLLSCGILFIRDNQLIFFDYKKYKGKVFNTESLKGKQVKSLGKLQNEKFCVYCLNDTYIYQFNKENYSIKEINHVNVNLHYLIETKEHQFINFASKGIYIWSKLKKIFVHNEVPCLYLYLTIFIFAFIIIYITPSSFSGFEVDGFNLKCNNYKKLFLPLFLFCCMFCFLYYKYYYLLNPYKLIFHKYIQGFERIGISDFYVVDSFYNIDLFNIKTFEMTRLFNGNGNLQYLIVNSKIILVLNLLNNQFKVYDVSSKQVINEFIELNMNQLYKTIKIGDNLFITKKNKELFKWKYDFENKKIKILKRKQYEHFNDNDLILDIVNNKLYVLNGIPKDNLVHDIYLNAYE